MATRKAKEKATGEIGESCFSGQVGLAALVSEYADISLFALAEAVSSISAQNVIATRNWLRTEMKQMQPFESDEQYDPSCDQNFKPALEAVAVHFHHFVIPFWPPRGLFAQLTPQILTAYPKARALFLPLTMGFGATLFPTKFGVKGMNLTGFETKEDTAFEFLAALSAHFLYLHVFISGFPPKITCTREELFRYFEPLVMCQRKHGVLVIDFETSFAPFDTFLWDPLTGARCFLRCAPPS